MNLGTPIAIGNTAKIYLYENKVYKVFNDYFAETESLKEAEKQKIARSYGLPVPKIIDVTAINGQQAIIMEYIKGKSIGDLLLEDMKQAAYYLNISIEIQQKIHGVEADSMERMSEKLTRQIESAAILDNRHKSILIEKLNRMSSKNMLCHGDFHLFNLIMSDDKVTIIDWIDSSSGDIRADVYRTYLLYANYSSELADQYLNLYCEKTDLQKGEIIQWAPIIAAARLAEIVPSENPNRLLDIIYQYHPL